MVTLNEDARNSFLNLIKMTNFEIESLRLAEFNLHGQRTSAIGTVEEKEDRTGYYFNPHFIFVTDEIHESLQAEDNGLLTPVGHPEPHAEQ
jgi:hypothetical protein